MQCFILYIIYIVINNFNILFLSFYSNISDRYFQFKEKSEEGSEEYFQNLIFLCLSILTDGPQPQNFGQISTYVALILI